MPSSLSSINYITTRRAAGSLLLRTMLLFGLGVALHLALCIVRV